LPHTNFGKLIASNTGMAESQMTRGAINMMATTITITPTTVRRGLHRTEACYNSLQWSRLFTSHIRTSGKAEYLVDLPTTQ